MITDSCATAHVAGMHTAHCGTMQRAGYAAADPRGGLPGSRRFGYRWRTLSSRACLTPSSPASRRHRRCRSFRPLSRVEGRGVGSRANWLGFTIPTPSGRKPSAGKPARRTWRWTALLPAIDALIVAAPAEAHFQLAARRCGPESTCWSRSRSPPTWRRRTNWPRLARAKAGWCCRSVIWSGSPPPIALCRRARGRRCISRRSASPRSSRAAPMCRSSSI